MTLFRVFSMALLLIAPASTAAAKGPNPDRAARRAAMQQRMAEIRVRVLQEEVGLDKASAQRAAKVMEGFQGLRRGFRLQQKQAREQLQYLLDTNSSDMARYKAEVAKVRAAHQELEKLKLKEFDALSKALSPKQTALLVLGLKRVQKRLKRQMRRHRRGKHGPPHRGRHGPGGGGF